MKNIFEGIEMTPILYHPNYRLIPVTVLDISEEGMNKFNAILRWIKNRRKWISRIIRTPSGGISYDTVPPAYDMRRLKSGIEITLLVVEGMCRVQFRSKLEGASGSQAFIKFREICSQYGINLDKYKIKNGEEIKKEIQKPLICLAEALEDTVYEHCHHIDFHSSYTAGLANTHPEFREPLEYIYRERKNHPEYKLILNASIGYMQSIGCCNAKWAHLSRDAIADNNARVQNMAERLFRSGRSVLCFNTDGIWYAGKIYHGTGEGDNLGQWSNDHVDCTVRFKSAGAYEYIEKGIYCPVIRGKTKLDLIKPRTEWSWGDIYHDSAKAIRYYYDEEKEEIAHG